MILFIDTATEKAVVILHSESQEATKEFAEFPHSEHFPELITNFLRAHRVKLKDLTHIAVRVGPGSFSKIRTGVVAANALAYGLGMGVVPVTGEVDFNEIKTQGGERIAVPLYDAEPTITLSKKKKL